MTDNLDANYKAAYNNRLGYGMAPALILVDFVKAYFDRSCELFAGVDDALASAKRLLELARKGGVPVIYTNVVYHPDGRDGGVFFQKAKPLRHLVAGNPMGAWAEGIAPRDGELVVTKQYPSAFFGTSLSSTLAAGGIDTLIITGLTTSGCVRATCVDACSSGFRPMVVADACGDRHQDPHNANLFDMNAKYGDVVSEEDVSTYLENIKAVGL